MNISSRVIKVEISLGFGSSFALVSSVGNAQGGDGEKDGVQLGILVIAGDCGHISG